jgi:hypothetical protein
VHFKVLYHGCTHFSSQDHNFVLAIFNDRFNNGTAELTRASSYSNNSHDFGIVLKEKEVGGLKSE